MQKLQVLIEPHHEYCNYLMDALWQMWQSISSWSFVGMFLTHPFIPYFVYWPFFLFGVKHPTGSIWMRPYVCRHRYVPHCQIEWENNLWHLFYTKFHLNQSLFNASLTTCHLFQQVHLTWFLVCIFQIRTSLWNASWVLKVLTSTFFSLCQQMSAKILAKS